MLKRLLLAAVLVAGLDAAQAGPQPAKPDLGSGLTVTPGPAPQSYEGKPIAAMSPDQLMKIPAKKLFGAMKAPSTAIGTHAIGFYAKGCLAGAAELPTDGPAWQVMRLSRHRNFGHPAMIALIEKLATEARANDNWPGLLVGDIAMPRGGPMPSGHASHQVGLDADIWLTPMPNRTLSRREREDMAARLVVKDRKRIDPAVWTVAHMRLIQRAASYKEVARIFVHPPIKAELCKWATGDRAWLAKVRPYFGHNYHFHIRINCPEGSPSCKNQPPAVPKDGTGCGDELSYWMGDKAWPQEPKDKKPVKPAKPPPPLTLSGLPAECRAVVTAE